MVRSDSCVLAGEGPLPKLSIVIPVYNERYLVGELLRRVAAAGIPSAGDIEIVVVDIDDLYQEDHYGAEMLHALERARRFNHWLAAALRPLLGDRVLEIGAGIGSISIWLLPRERYVVSEVNPDYLHYLGNLIRGKPYMAAARRGLGMIAAARQPH